MGGESKRYPGTLRLTIGGKSYEVQGEVILPPPPLNPMPTPEQLRDFAWATMQGIVFARQLVKLAEGEVAEPTIADELSQLAPRAGWRYETDAEFRARILEQANGEKQKGK